MKQFLVMLLIMPLSMSGATVGSDTSTTFFSTQQTLNGGDRVAGFAALRGGFVLASGSSATFDSFFPVSGIANFNAGVLTLDRDLIFDETAEITSIGGIIAQGHTVELGLSTTYLTFVASGGSGESEELSLLATYDVDTDVRSIDWSYDDQYIVAGKKRSGAEEISVLKFDGSLSLADDEELGDSDVTSVRWHPSAYYIAIGRRSISGGSSSSGGGEELLIYELLTPSEQLNYVDGINIGSDVRAVAWRPSGSHLAVGTRASSSELCVYPVTSGVLGTPIQFNMPSGHTIQNDTMVWDPTGTYLAAGLSRGSSTELRVYEFDGSSLSLFAEVEVGEAIRAIDWNPDQAQGSFIAIGTNRNSQRLHIYEFDSGAQTLTERSSVAETKTIFSLHWSPNGEYLAFGRDQSGTGSEFRVYSFDKATQALTLVDELEVTRDVDTVRWSHDGNKIARGDDNDFVSVYSFVTQAGTTEAFFNALTLSLTTDVVLNSPIKFQGSCMIQGNGNKLIFGNGGSIVIDSGGTLTCKDITFDNVSGTQLRGTDASSSCVFDSVTLYLADDTSFTAGSLSCCGHVNVIGEYTFSYASDQQCLINAFSSLRCHTGTTFTYAPSISSKTLLSCVDETAQIVLDGATLRATNVGLQLTKGVLLVNGISLLYAEGATEATGITLGDNAVAANNFPVLVRSGAQLCTQGYVTDASV